MTTENNLMAQVQECCAKIGLPVFVVNQTTLAFHASAVTGNFQIYIHVNHSSMRLESFLPVRVPAKQAAAVFVYVVKLNENLALPKLGFNKNSGAVYLIDGITVADGVLTTNMFKALFFPFISDTDSAFAGLLQILFAQNTPLEAFQWLLDRSSSSEEADEEEETDSEEDITQLLDDIDSFLLEAGDD